MITFSTFKSAVIEAGSRVLKVAQFGVKTADECAPFGDDSNPLANMTAVYAETSESGEQVIIGYLNTKQLAGSGEKRFYSLKPDKSLSFYMWLRNNGTMEIGGTGDNLVRYQELVLGLAEANGKLNTELGKISAAIGGLGGVYIPSNVTTDISSAKIEEIKCL